MQRAKKQSIKRRLDWIRLSYILDQKGEMSLEELTFSFNEMFKNGKTNREISSIISSYKSYGFETRKIQKIRVYSFNGNLPYVNTRTKNRWLEKIESL